MAALVQAVGVALWTDCRTRMPIGPCGPRRRYTTKRSGPMRARLCGDGALAAGWGPKKGKPSTRLGLSHFESLIGVFLTMNFRSSMGNAVNQFVEARSTQSKSRARGPRARIARTAAAAARPRSKIRSRRSKTLECATVAPCCYAPRDRRAMLRSAARRWPPRCTPRQRGRRAALLERSDREVVERAADPGTRSQDS